MKPTGPALALVLSLAAQAVGVRMFDRGDTGNGLAFVIAGLVGWVLVLGAAWGRRRDDGPLEPVGIVAKLCRPVGAAIQ